MKLHELIKSERNAHPILTLQIFIKCARFSFWVRKNDIVEFEDGIIYIKEKSNGVINAMIPDSDECDYYAPTHSIIIP